jgi:hypothetical protein
LFSLLTILPSVLYAQTATTGAVVGIVSDPTGAVVLGARITLTHPATGSVQTATSDSGGRYVFPVVSPGTYALKVEAQGFRTNLTNDLVVEVNKSINANLKLEVGASSEIVEVNATSMVEVQTQDSSVGEVLSGTELNRLPVNGRSAMQLIFLQPGVQPDMGHQGIDSDDAGGQIGGARSDQVTFGIDGGDATSDLEGSNNYNSPSKESQALSAVVPTPQDAVEEFRVATNNANATFGQASGQVSVLTKSGTNSIHGQLYEYHQDSGLSANGFDNNETIPITKKPVWVDNRFGVGLGGAIIKDKLFYYGFYEGRRFHDSASFNKLVPSAQLRTGIIELNGVQYNLCNPTTPGCNPTPTVPFNAGCSGPCDPRLLGISPVVMKEMALLPAGNDLSEGDGVNTVGFDGNFSTPISTEVGKLKLNYNINSKWSAFTSWQYSSTARTGTEQISLELPAKPASVSADPYFANFYAFQIQGQISPTFLSVTHGSFLKNWWGWTRATPAPLVTGTDAALQLAGEAVLDTASGYGSSFLFTNPININTQQARPRVWDGHDWYIAQNFTKIRGSHQFQFGGEGRLWHDYHMRTDDVVGGLSTAPIYYVGSSNLSEYSYAGVGPAYTPTALPTTLGPYWDGYYATLLGIVDHSAQVETRNGSFAANPLGTPTLSHYTLPSFNGYFNDVWKARRNLTVTMGLNWGVTLSAHEANGLESVLVYADSNSPVNMQQFLKSRAAALESGGTYNPTFGESPVNSLASPFNGRERLSSWKDIGPRFSVAWEVKPGLVVRGGYSLVWDRSSAVTSVLGGLLAGGLNDVDRCGGPTFSVGSGTAVCSQTGTTPLTAYRIGPGTSGPGQWDGASVPIPPGTNDSIPNVPNVSNQAFASLGQDAYLTPGYAHVIDFTIQKALRAKYFLEVGYTGRFSRNITNAEQLNAPDYRQKDPTSGQTYAQATDALTTAVATGTTPAPQPFFENLGNAATCNTINTAVFGVAPTGCTTAAYYTMAFYGGPGDLGYDDYLLNGGFIGASVFNTPTANNQIFENAQTTDGGFSDYNGMIVSLRKAMSRGLQFQINYTWSHAIGNHTANQQYSYSSNSPYNLNVDRASEGFDHRQTMTANWYYELPFGKGKPFNTSNGVADRVVGGWSLSGIFNFWTGQPVCATNLDGNYGSFFESQCAIAPSGFPSFSRHNGVTGSNGVGTAGRINAFANPAAVFASLQYPLLSVDPRVPYDELHAFPFWNVDLSLGKKIAITERVGMVITADAFNVFNHTVLNVPSTMDLTNPGGFGVLNQQLAAGIATTGARTMQLGMRIEF